MSSCRINRLGPSTTDCFCQWLPLLRRLGLTRALTPVTSPSQVWLIERARGTVGAARVLVLALVAPNLTGCAIFAPVAALSVKLALGLAWSVSVGAVARALEPC